MNFYRIKRQPVFQKSDLQTFEIPTVFSLFSRITSPLSKQFTRIEILQMLSHVLDVPCKKILRYTHLHTRRFHIPLRVYFGWQAYNFLQPPLHVLRKIHFTLTLLHLKKHHPDRMLQMFLYHKQKYPRFLPPLQQIASSYCYMSSDFLLRYRRKYRS